MPTAPARVSLPPVVQAEAAGPRIAKLEQDIAALKRTSEQIAEALGVSEIPPPTPAFGRPAFTEPPRPGATARGTSPISPEDERRGLVAAEEFDRRHPALGEMRRVLTGLAEGAMVGVFGVLPNVPVIGRTLPGPKRVIGTRTGPGGTSRYAEISAPGITATYPSSEELVRSGYIARGDAGTLEKMAQTTGGIASFAPAFRLLVGAVSMIPGVVTPLVKHGIAFGLMGASEKATEGGSPEEILGAFAEHAAGVMALEGGGRLLFQALKPEAASIVSMAKQLGRVQTAETMPATRAEIREAMESRLAREVQAQRAPEMAVPAESTGPGPDMPVRSRAPTLTAATAAEREAFARGGEWPKETVMTGGEPVAFGSRASLEETLRALAGVPEVGAKFRGQWGEATVGSIFNAHDGRTLVWVKYSDLHGEWVDIGPKRGGAARGEIPPPPPVAPAPEVPTARGPARPEVIEIPSMAADFKVGAYVNLGKDMEGRIEAVLDDGVYLRRGDGSGVRVMAKHFVPVRPSEGPDITKPTVQVPLRSAPSVQTPREPAFGRPPRVVTPEVVEEPLARVEAEAARKAADGLIPLVGKPVPPDDTFSPLWLALESTWSRSGATVEDAVADALKRLNTSKRRILIDEYSTWRSERAQGAPEMAELATPEGLLRDAGFPKEADALASRGRPVATTSRDITGKALAEPAFGRRTPSKKKEPEAPVAPPVSTPTADDAMNVSMASVRKPDGAPIESLRADLTKLIEAEGAGTLLDRAKAAGITTVGELREWSGAIGREEAQKRTHVRSILDEPKAGESPSQRQREVQEMAAAADRASQAQLLTLSERNMLSGMTRDLLGDADASFITKNLGAAMRERLGLPEKATVRELREAADRITPEGMPRLDREAVGPGPVRAEKPAGARPSPEQVERAVNFWKKIEGEGTEDLGFLGTQAIAAAIKRRPVRLYSREELDALTVLWDEFRAVNRPAEEFLAAKGFQGRKLKRMLRRMTEAAQEIPRPELEPPTRVIPDSEFGTEARPGRRSLPPAEPIPGQPPPPSPPWPGLGKTPPTDVPPPGLPPASGFEMPETSLAGPLLAGAGEPGAVPAVTRGGLTVPGGALDVRRGIENLTTGAKIGIGQVLAEKFHPAIHIALEHAGPWGIDILMAERAANRGRAKLVAEVLGKGLREARGDIERGSPRDRKVARLLDTLDRETRPPTPAELGTLDTQERTLFDFYRRTTNEAADRMRLENRKKEYFHRTFDRKAQDIMHEQWRSELRALEDITQRGGTLAPAQAKRAELLRDRLRASPEGQEVPSSVFFGALEPRVPDGAPLYSLSAIDSLTDYVLGAAKVIYHEPFLKEALRIYGNLPDRAKPYFKRFLKDFSGQGRDLFDKYASSAVAVEYLLKLFANPRSMSLNVTQHANTAAQMLGRPLAYPKAVGAAIGLDNSPVARAARKAFNDGYYLEDIHRWELDLTGSPFDKSLDKAMRFGMWGFARVEAGNRRTNFVGAYMDAIKRGRSPIEARLFSENEMFKLQFAYGIERPELLRNPKGAALLPFMNFPANQLSLYWRWAKHEPEKLVAYLILADGGVYAAREFLGMDFTNAGGTGLDWSQMIEMAREIPKGDIDKILAHAKRAHFPLVSKPRGPFPAGFTLPEEGTIPIPNPFVQDISNIVQWAGGKKTFTQAVPVPVLRHAMEFVQSMNAVHPRAFKQALGVATGEEGTSELLFGRPNAPETYKRLGEQRYPIFGKNNELRNLLSFYALMLRTVGPRPAEESLRDRTMEEWRQTKELLDKKQEVETILKETVEMAKYRLEKEGLTALKGGEYERALKADKDLKALLGRYPELNMTKEQIVDMYSEIAAEKLKAGQESMALEIVDLFPEVILPPARGPRPPRPPRPPGMRQQQEPLMEALAKHLERQALTKTERLVEGEAKVRSLIWRQRQDERKPLFGGQFGG